MWDTLCAPNVSLIQKFHPIAWCVHTQQLNLRLDAIRGHCDSMGYGSEINPPHMNTRDQASRITESANNSLEASGRSLTHTCAHCTMHLMNQKAYINVYYYGIEFISMAWDLEANCVLVCVFCVG